PRSGERVRGAGNRRATDRFAVPPGAGEGPAGPGVGRTRSRWPAPGAHGACATMSRPAHAWWTFILRPAGQPAARQHAPPRPRADAARVSAPSAGTPRAPADGAPDRAAHADGLRARHARPVRPARRDRRGAWDHAWADAAGRRA